MIKEQANKKKPWKREELLTEMETIYRELIQIAKRENKKIGFCIGNTTQKIDHDYFFTPIRNTSRCVAGSIIIDCVSIAVEIAKALDGRVDYFFIDTEKKISPELYGESDAGNVERAVKEVVQESKILTYKGNDLIVDAIDGFLAQLITTDDRGLGGKTVAIIGVGNIGFKLALKLTERGSHVVLVRRNTKALDSIVQALNTIKPRSTIAKIHGTSSIDEAVQDADIIIGLTPGTQDITAHMIEGAKEGVVLIDGGKGSFSPEAIECATRRGLKVYRASITPSFEGQVSMLLRLEEMISREVGRLDIKGISVVAGSLLGAEGDVILDSISNPTQVYGVANGCGDFKRDLSNEEKDRLETLKEHINNQL